MFRRLNPIGRPQVEYEQLFPGRQTYARYLHVAEAVAEDEAQAAWDGLGGRLKALRREVVDGKAVQALFQAEVKADVADVKADMKAGQAEAKTDMEEVKAGQAEMKAEMAGMKALLEKLVAQSLQNAA
jgi:hypothetical protein